MALINDLKFSKLGTAGFTGAVRDRELAWLQSIGATSNNINDAWREMASNGFTTEMRWVPRSPSGDRRAYFPTTWQPSTSNWAIAMEFLAISPNNLGFRYFVSSLQDGVTINDGIHFGFSPLTNEYFISVDQNFSPTGPPERLIPYGESDPDTQIRTTLNSDGTIETVGTPGTSDTFAPLVYPNPSQPFIYIQFGSSSYPIAAQFIDKDNSANTRSYEFTIDQVMQPADTTTFLDVNGQNAMTISGTTEYFQTNVRVMGGGTGGAHINEIKRNYYLANGGSGDQFNDIELSFWQAF